MAPGSASAMVGSMRTNGMGMVCANWLLLPNHDMAAPLGVQCLLLAFLSVWVWLAWSNLRVVVWVVMLLCAAFVLPLLATSYLPYQRPRQPPPLYLATPDGWRPVPSWYQRQQESPRTPLHPNISLELNEAIDDFLDLLLDQFILQWYNPLTSPEVSSAFVQSVDRIIRSCLEQLVHRAIGIDWPGLIIKSLMPIVTEHCRLFKLAGGLQTEEHLDLTLPRAYASLSKSGRLHPAVDVPSLHSRSSEEKWLRARIERILTLLLPPHEQSSAAVQIMAREIVTVPVALNTIDKLSSPDFINNLINNILIDLAKEKDQVQRMPARAATTISVDTSDKAFDRLVKSFKKMDIATARQMRDIVASKLDDAKRLNSNDAKARAHVARLTKAQEIITRHIRNLGGAFQEPEPVVVGNLEQLINVLRILENQTSFDLWLEYMEKSGRRDLPLFWKTARDLADPFNVSAVNANDNDSVNDFKDVAKALLEMLTSSEILMKIVPNAQVITVQRFVEQDNPDSQSMRVCQEAFNQIMAACQTEMEEHDFPAFRAVHHWHKVARALQPTSQMPSPDASALLPPRQPLQRPHLTPEPAFVPIADPSSLFGTDDASEHRIFQKDPTEETHVLTKEAINEAMRSSLLDNAHSLALAAFDSSTMTRSSSSLAADVAFASEAYLDPGSGDVPTTVDADEGNAPIEDLVWVDDETTEHASQKRKTLGSTRRALELEKEAYEALTQASAGQVGLTGPFTCLRFTTEKNKELRTIVYVVEYAQVDMIGVPTQGGLVGHRYSEFAAFKSVLEKKFKSLRQLEFPPPSPSYDVEIRRRGLETWLRAIFSSPETATSKELLDFLNNKSSFSLRSGSWPSLGLLPRAAKIDVGIQSAPAAEQPLFDLLTEVLEFVDAWSMRQFIFALVQQWFGATLYKKLHESIQTRLEGDSAVQYINRAKELLFPGGHRQAKPRPVLADFSVRSAAKEGLRRWFMGYSTLFNNADAARAANTVFMLVQNARLNKNLMYEIIDTILNTLFPEFLD